MTLAEWEALIAKYEQLAAAWNDTNPAIGVAARLNAFKDTHLITDPEFAPVFEIHKQLAALLSLEARTVRAGWDKHIAKKPVTDETGDPVFTVPPSPIDFELGVAGEKR